MVGEHLFTQLKSGQCNGDSYRYLPVDVLQENAPAIRVLGHLVGADHVNRYWNAEAMFLRNDGEMIDIIIAMCGDFCGFNSEVRVRADIVEHWLATSPNPALPNRQANNPLNMRPGDPLANMTASERQGWEIIQMLTGLEHFP